MGHGRRFWVRTCDSSLNRGVGNVPISLFNSPFLLGFDDLEQALDRVTKSYSDGYPPYNIERTGENDMRISLAVAGFLRDELSVSVEDTQLTIRGRQLDNPNREFLHRGIAARQFQRSFVLADGIKILGAELDNGLLHINLRRPVVETQTRTIEIKSGNKRRKSNLQAIDIEPEEKVS